MKKILSIFLCPKFKKINSKKSFKKSIFLVKDPDKEYTEEQLLESFYREILKKHCKDFTE